MVKCPLKVDQKIFEVYKTRDTGFQNLDTPGIRAWTVTDITEDREGWYALIEHFFTEKDYLGTRTITPLLWRNVYHEHAAHAIQHTLDDQRNLVATLYKSIETEKHYQYHVEQLGIVVQNNNKQGNPLDIDIF